MTVYNYPAPRYKEYKEPTSVEECLIAARGLVTKLAEGESRPSVGVSPHLYTREGSKFLFVTEASQNQYIAEAVKQALMEQGAAKVDFITFGDVGAKEPEPYPVEEGWRESDGMRKRGPVTETGVEPEPTLGALTAKYLDDHLEYSFVCEGSGGPATYFELGRHGHKWNSFWPYAKNWERFMCESHYLPIDVHFEIENRMIKPLGDACEVRMTDPQGTHLEYSVTEDVAKRFQKWAFLHGHLFMDPLIATSHVYGGKRRTEAPDYIQSIDVPRVSGVMGGTSNHAGYYPYMENRFEDGHLVEVKGGGQYGEIIREMMYKYKDIEWPGYPEKGMFWYCATEICTTIGAQRILRSQNWNGPNTDERNRMGVYHGGWGTWPPRKENREYEEYAKKYAPKGHLHYHLYFFTMEIKIRGTDYWYKILDKGWVTAMDDPVVRAMAAKYGDPDEILKYDWIPPLPGINCEGDYMRDYAPDPVAYLKKRAKEGKTI